MTQPFSRRDFLKLTGLLPLSLAAPRFMQNPPNAKNAIIIVFDALTAYNISLYGYSRETMPNLAKLAERAIVYNRHYSGGNYTTTGTATLLTGTQPWTHRAFDLGSEVSPAVAEHTIFHAFKDYHRLAYTHNIFVETLFQQFQKALDEWLPRNQLFLGSYGSFISSLFGNDEDLASVSWVRAIKKEETGYAYSLFASRLYEPLQDWNYRAARAQFPRGVPSANQDDGFLLSAAIDWIADRLAAAPQPFFGYFHLLPPHAPYRTSLEFYNHFKDDGYQVVKKPISIFEQGQDKYDLFRKRIEYDEFILYVDQEFGRLYKRLESAGLLENTVIVLTSDHGEMNERGISGHSNNTLYEPLIRVPLLIFDPGRKERADVDVPTSAVDLLATLLHLTNQALPEWNEGVILPPFNPSAPDPQRSIYVLRAMKNEQDAPIAADRSISLIKGRYKLHYYADYPELKKTGAKELIYLFDVEADPEELLDLASAQPDVAAELLKELKAKLAEVNQPYVK